MDSDASFSSGSDSENEELVALSRSKLASSLAEKKSIYNADALHEKLEDLSWSEQVAWSETMALTSATPSAVANVDDDVERELGFYTQALDAAREAAARMESAGVAWARPADYYAEMVKTDEHMARVKEQLQHEQKLIADMEQRRKDRENKRHAKQIQVEKKKERDQERKQGVDAVTRMRRERARNQYEGELDMEAELREMEGGGRGRGRGRGGPKSMQRFQPRAKAAHREARDQKYGHGGPKRLSKQNDAFSAADTNSYRSSGGRGG
ncbi:rRNA processing protein EBP2, partial [Helicosporidium sp. ATCC 50920]